MDVRVIRVEMKSRNPANFADADFFKSCGERVAQIADNLTSALFTFVAEQVVFPFIRKGENVMQKVVFLERASCDAQPFSRLRGGEIVGAVGEEGARKSPLPLFVEL